LQYVRHREIVSGGALEAFAGCPVKWLVERQLEPRELAGDSDALVRGSFMHEVLERLIGRLGGPVTARTLDAAQGILGELVGEVPETLAPGQDHAVRVAMLRAIEADLRRYLEHEASAGCDWVPRALELRFGFDEADGSLPAVVLGEGKERVRLRGMIDRIDVDQAGAGAIVRDYKSGANRQERAAARWLSDHQFQVALYMLAVRRLLGLEPVAGFYQPLTGRDLRARGAYVSGTPVGGAVYGTDALEREALEQLLAEVEQQAVEVAATLARGELTPCPATCSRDGCRHPGICWAG
jgi:RecB family exonuclease